MTVLITLLGQLGLAEQYRRLAAVAVLSLAALAAATLLKQCYDRSVIADHQAIVERRADQARDRADAERTSDAANLGANQRDLVHAIDAAPKGGTLSPAAHALACERLRKLGRVPPGCGPQGTD